MDKKRVERIASKVEATVDAVSLARQLAKLHKKATEEINKFGDQYHRQMETAGRAEDALQKAILRDASSIGSVLDILKESRLDPGVMSSRLVNTIESITKDKLFPSPWKTETAGWALVST